MGLLIYAITMTCLYFRYALSRVNQYYANPNSTHIAVVIQILRYVHDILHYGLSYTKSNPKFVRYTDAD